MRLKHHLGVGSLRPSATVTNLSYVLILWLANFASIVNSLVFDAEHAASFTLSLRVLRSCYSVPTAVDSFTFL